MNCESGVDPESGCPILVAFCATGWGIWLSVPGRDTSSAAKRLEILVALEKRTDGKFLNAAPSDYAPTAF